MSHNEDVAPKQGPNSREQGRQPFVVPWKGPEEALIMLGCFSLLIGIIVFVPFRSLSTVLLPLGLISVIVGYVMKLAAIGVEVFGDKDDRA